MATLLAAANINFTGNWLVGDATSLNDSEAASTALTTSFVSSTAFTPGAITVDGVAIKIASRAAGSPTNVLSLRLANAGVDVVGTDVSMNVSDINVCTNTALTGNEGGWYYFRFNVAGTPTPVLLVAATAYTLQLKLDSTSTAVSCYSSSGTNWTRNVVTTTTAAPAAADRLMICGDNLAAGTKNSYTVTMNNTATTSFGSTATQALTVNKGGTLTLGTTASTAYYLKVKGVIRVFSGGTWNEGTVGTPLPSSSTFVLEHDATSAVDSGLELANGSTWNSIGNAITNTWTKMTADKAAAQTVITVADTTGWANSDVVVFGSTTATPGQAEKKTITTVDSATQITLSAGLTNAHAGTTAPIQAEVGNITRNIKHRGVSATLVGYVYISTTAVVDVRYAEFTALGNFTSNKSGVEITTTTGSASFKYCSLYDSTQATAIGFKISGAAWNNVTLQGNVIYNMNATGISTSATTGTNYLIDNNLVVGTGSGAGSGAFALGDLGGVITGNYGNSSNASSNFIISAADAIGTFSGNNSHSASSSGFSFTGSIPSGTMSTITSWRNTSSGISLTGGSPEFIIDGGIFFGNNSAGITIQSGAGRMEFVNCVLNAGVTVLQTIGVALSGTSLVNFNSCTFGATTAHSSADISVTSAGATVYVNMNNCLLSSATEILNQSNMSESSFIGSQKHDQVSGSNKMWRKYGTIQIDTTIFDVTPSMRMTPNNATGRIQPLYFWAACTSGSAVTVSVKVRESVVGDGTAYNGNRIRLMVRKNYSVGITSDTVLATATASSTGAFELISGTTAVPSEDGTLEFYVDANGTTGWVNIDSITITPVADSTSFKFWGDGSPTVYGNNSSGSGAAGFVIL